MAGTRTTNVHLEVLSSDDGEIRVGKIQADVLGSGDGDVRVGKIQAEVLGAGTSTQRVAQIGAMVIGTPAVASSTPPHSDDWSAETPGSDPTGWSPGWDAAADDFPAVAMEEAMGGVVLRHQDTTAGDYALFFDAAGTVQDCHHQMRFMLTSASGRQCGFVARASGSAGTENGYVFFVNGDELEVGKLVAGSYTQLAVTSGFNLKFGHWYWMEATCLDVTLQLRVYEHGDPRPGTANLSVIDADILEEGQVGLFAGEGPGYRHIDYVALSGSFFSTPPAGPLTFGEVAKIVDGVQLYDTFTRTDGDIDAGSPDEGPDWVIDGSDNPPQIKSNVLRYDNGDTKPVRAYLPLPTDTSEELMVIAKGRRDDPEMTMQLFGAVDTDAWSSMDGYGNLVVWDSGFPVHAERIREKSGGSNTDLVSPNPGAGTWYYDGETNYEGHWHYARAGQVGVNSGAGPTYDDTHSGNAFKRFWLEQDDPGTGSGYTELDYIAVFANNRLTVKELPDGYTIEAFGETATAYAGIAVIQLHGTFKTSGFLLPDSSLVIKDDMAATVQTVNETGIVGFGSLYYPSTPPNKPTLSSIAYGPTWWNVQGSPYVHPEGAVLQEVQFQIDDAVDFATPVEDEVLGDDEAASTSFSFTDAGDGLLDNTQYWARVRYKGSGSWSEWSDAITITTTDAVNPDTPTLSLISNFVDGARIGITPYSHPDGQDTLDNWLVPHVSTDWQITTSTDGLFASPFVDVDDDPINLEELLSIGGMSAGTTYLARARVKDANGIQSDWSNTLSFVTDSDAVDQPGTPTVTVDEARIRGGDFSTNAYNHPMATAHGSTVWLITSASGFSPVVVTEDSATELEAWTTDPMTQGLLPDTDYWVRAKWVSTLGEEGPWSAAVSFTTAEALGGPDWVTPLNSGAVLSGASQGIEVAQVGGGALGGGVTAKIEHSDDWGATWNTLQNTATLTYTWDTTMEADGLHLLRTSLDDGTEQSLYDYRVVQINNGSDPEFVNREIEPDASDIMSGEFNEQGDWLRQWWHNYVNWWSIFAMNDRDPGGPPSFLSLSQSPKPGKVTLITQFFLSGFEGGFPWSKYWDTEINRAGVAGHSGGLRGDRGWSIDSSASPGVDDVPLKGWSAELSNWTIWPFGDARVIGQRGWSSSQNSLAVLGERGDGMAGPGLLGSINGSVGVRVRDAYGAGLHHVPKYTVVVEATPTPLANGRVDLGIKAMAVGPGIVLDGDWQVDGVLTNMEACGEAGLSKSQTSFWGQGYARFHTFGVMAQSEAECAPGSECPEDPTLSVSNILDTTVTLTGSAFVIPGIPALSYTATAGASEVAHAWTNADGGQYAKRVYYWEPGEAPATHAGVIVRSVNPNVPSTTTALPVASGTHTYGVATIAGDGTILGWSNYDTVVIP